MLAVRNRENGSRTRKRQSEVVGESSNSRQRTREPSPDDELDRDAYDPDQSMRERRQIAQALRGMQHKMKENPDEYLQPDGTALMDYFKESDMVMKNVKQTVEATIDSRGLVIAADLSARRVQRLTSGTTANGVDVDEFVSKCITYMRHGGGIQNDEAVELSSTQRQRRQPTRGAIGSDDDEVGDDGDMENWAHLGRFAVIPNIHRPALPGFLMGPLSIEKKARKTAIRSAPFKVSNLREVRPEELRAEDLKKSDKNDLPSICKKIYDQLSDVQRIAQDTAEEDLLNLEKLAEAEGLTEEEQAEKTREIMDRLALRDTGGIDLMRFVVNPHSFGQTVENLFYVSFLIREGSFKLQFDDNDLPTIGMKSFTRTVTSDADNWQSRSRKIRPTTMRSLGMQQSGTRQSCQLTWGYGKISLMLSLSRSP